MPKRKEKTCIPKNKQNNKKKKEKQTPKRISFLYFEQLIILNSKLILMKISHYLYKYEIKNTFSIEDLETLFLE